MPARRCAGFHLRQTRCPPVISPPCPRSPTLMGEEHTPNESTTFPLSSPGSRIPVSPGFYQLRCIRTVRPQSRSRFGRALYEVPDGIECPISDSAARKEKENLLLICGVPPCTTRSIVRMLFRVVAQRSIFASFRSRGRRPLGEEVFHFVDIVIPIRPQISEVLRM